MKRNGSKAIGRRLASAAVMGMTMVVALAWPSTGRGQAQPPGQAKHGHQHQAGAKPPEAGDAFADQVRQLRDKVARLEAALSQGQGAGRSSPTGQGQGMVMGTRVGGKVPAGYRIAAQYADCLRCHQTIPSGPLPPSHLEKAGGMAMGMTEGGGKPDATPTAPNESPIDQLQRLRDQVAKLEAVLSQGQGPGQSRPMSQGQGMGMMGQGGMGMGMMGGKGAGPAKGMGMMDDMDMGMMGREMGQGGMDMMGGGMGMGTMGGAGAGPAKGMGMIDDMDMGMMGMGAMGKAKRVGMGSMGMATSLPGFPGISHLYHIGADGVFLNHVEHISLSADQRKKLNRIKEKAVLGGSSCERKVEEAEQELWELTASDAPDAAAIEAKVREIEKLRGDQRLAFIRAVGEAAKVLTDDQRQALAGTATEAHSRPATVNP
ncbi:MAG: periplasmic heavy metal sensor [Gemmatimonadales bacterium]|nr:periplasmic heavy metal sensor [Gemmatimonadales bacterium]